ncbi:hypothetical protein BD779DRAFT_1490522 [Infundibulicybe gibba]|nr:hypothetical protein BD779DRAFT_1490522 [Infundibulicybe gibba]
MPRLLPQLIAALEKQPKDTPHIPFDIAAFRPRRKSLYRPVPPRPSLNPSRHNKSVLLTSDNPITNSRLYAQHKRLPPRMALAPRHVRVHNHDESRGMSEQERQWWANPYLRMLASPIRKCIVTGQYIPSDFLVRLGPMRLPLVPGQAVQHTTLIPDGLQHTKFTARRVGRAAYALCSRTAILQIVERNAHCRVTRHMKMDANAAKWLADRVAHLLRLRILQELELLADRLEGGRACTGGNVILRRLTREEWAAFRETGVIPHEDALAVVVVPPLNKDSTGKRPTASMSALPLDAPGPIPAKPLPPLSTLHYTASGATRDDQVLPEIQIPLYNGLALFPAREQRAALHALFLRLLSIERTQESSSELKGKASHAFLLRGNADIVLRADVAPTAIALWRLRLFEGQGWEPNGWIGSGST